MKNPIATDDSLLITISPGTVYISTDPDQSSYANIKVAIQNTGPLALSVKSIGVVLPATLAPTNGIGSVTPTADQPGLWSFTSSEFTKGEFDATPQHGEYVIMNAKDTWTFSLQMVTLVSTIVEPSADVTVSVIFKDKSSRSISLTIDIAPAVASISFNSQPANINPGQSAELSWSSEKIDYCIISPMDDTKRKPSGNLWVTPPISTIYTLFAYGDGIILSAQWAISVQIVQIVHFGGPAGQSTVNLGDNITLSWECNQFTESIELIDNRGVAIPPLDENGNTPQKGSITVGPITEPTIFTFTAYGNTKQNYDQRDPTININDLVYTIAASPTTGLWSGDKVTLTWHIESASAVSISPAIVNGPSLQNLSNSVVVNPPTNVPYVLTTSGFIDNSPVSNQAFPIQLSIEPVIINKFTMSPAIINPDTGSDSATLEWNVQAEVLSIDNGIGNVPATGNYPLVNTANGTVYTLTAGTNQNPGQQTQTFIVNNTYGPYTFNAITPGPPYLFETYFTVPIPGAMGSLQQVNSGGGAYTATFTGVSITGTLAGSGVFVSYNYQNPDQSYFLFTAWPAVTFAWTDINNPTGTLTLTGPLGMDSDSALEMLKKN